MRLIDYLDKGASLGPDRPCLTMDGKDLSYAAVQALTCRIARGLDRSGLKPGAKVAILSGNDPTAFSCVFGISRAGCVWCPVNPRNEAGENQFILDAFDCEALIFASAFAPVWLSGGRVLLHRTQKSAGLFRRKNSSAGSP